MPEIDHELLERFECRILGRVPHARDGKAINTTGRHI